LDLKVVFLHFSAADIFNPIEPWSGKDISTEWSEVSQSEGLEIEDANSVS
jgi:hypothetical protein